MPFQDNGLDIATIDWRRRVLAVGNVSTPVLLRVDQVIKGLKQIGVWSAIRRLNLGVGDNLSSSLIPQNNTLGGVADTNNNLLAADYSEWLGWQTDGSTKYLDTGFTPSQATGGLFVYMRTAQTVDATSRSIVGCNNSAGIQSFRIGANRGPTGALAGYVGGIWGADASVAQSSADTQNAAAGYYASRTSATDITLYKNGVAINTETTSRTPATAGVTLFVLCRNNNGATSQFVESGTRIAGYGIDSGLAAGPAMQFYRIIQDFQRSMGRAV